LATVLGLVDCNVTHDVTLFCVGSPIYTKYKTLARQNRSHRIKMQRDLVVDILYGSIYNQYKIVKKSKIANLIKLSVLGSILSSFIYRIVLPTRHHTPTDDI
jgi:hypothetical protein